MSCLFDLLKSNIASILSDNEVDAYDEFSDIDLLKNYNTNIGFVSVKSIERINGYENSLELQSGEVFIDIQCKVIAKRGLSASSLSQTINNIYADFIFSKSVIPMSIDIGDLKVNSLCSRFETTITMKFRYFLSEDSN